MAQHDHAPKVPKVQDDPELKDDSKQGFTRDTMISQSKRSRRHSGRGENASSRERETSSEHTPRKTRRRSREHSYESPGAEILVPPFEDWEKNPELADKYTGLFQIIGDSRKIPGTPIAFPVEPNTNKAKPKVKGCRCLSWLFK